MLRIESDTGPITPLERSTLSKRLVPSSSSHVRLDSFSLDQSLKRFPCRPERDRTQMFYMILSHVVQQKKPHILIVHRCPVGPRLSGASSLITGGFHRRWPSSSRRGQSVGVGRFARVFQNGGFVPFPGVPPLNPARPSVACTTAANSFPPPGIGFDEWNTPPPERI